MSFNNVIVGFDESPESIDALAFARDMAEPEAAITLAQIHDPGLTGARAALYDQEIEARLESMSASARPVLGGRRFDPVAVGGSPARQLNRLAHERGADLVVVGSTHRGPIGRVFVGSVADRLLNGSPCPVAVAPRGYAARMGKSLDRAVVVGYDGTEEAQRALETGKRVARALGAKLRLVAGLRALEPAPGRGPYVPIVKSHFLAALERAESECGRELAVETALVDGVPEEVLLRESEDARLLVVGSRGYGPVSRVLLGSVSSALVHDGACPVIVVPRGSGDESGAHEVGAPREATTGSPAAA